MMAASSAPFIILLFVPAVCEFNQIATTLTVSSVYQHHDASLANDGDFSQDIRRCAHTDTKKGIKEAWLRLDLVDVYSIKSVKFWYRNDRSNSRNTIRLRGYSIRVSNDSVLPPAETSCYTDSGNVTLPTVMEKDCKRTARFVWIYQDNTRDGPCPVLEICEVQVFGCELGTYEEDCTKTCNHCKNNASCGAASGKCNEEGCLLLGYQPPYCQHCIPGKYGPVCGQICSEFCKERTCDRITGSCLHGCQTGYTGTNCSKACEDNTYGEDCKDTCGQCLHDNCNHVNGTCVSGCEAGYKTALCKTPCDDGTYGENCLKTCSRQCLGNETCDRFSGACRACVAGLQGSKCDQKCRIGRYGQNCSEKCGACLNPTGCDHVTGQCSSDCQPGWRRTNKCDQACPDGTFGTHCRYNCSVNCEIGDTCNKQTGHCTRCTPGWIGDFCNERSGKPATDLEKMTLEHLKLDNERLVAETAFLKTRDKYYMLKILSEFPIQLQTALEPSMSEKKTIRKKHN